MEYRIKAKIVSMEAGLQEFEDIDMIRIKSSHHTLLIMQNFMPILGELDGYIDIVFEDHAIRLQELKGYYMHKKNEFSLLVQEGNPVPIEIEVDEDV